MRNCLNFRRLPHGLVGFKAAFRVDQVRRENGVDQSRLAEPGLSCRTEDETPSWSAYGFPQERTPLLVSKPTVASNGGATAPFDSMKAGRRPLAPHEASLRRSSDRLVDRESWPAVTYRSKLSKAYRPRSR